MPDHKTRGDPVGAGALPGCADFGYDWSVVRVLRLVVVVPALALLWCGGMHAQDTRPAAISATELRRHVVALGSDAFGGRAPGTVGGERAAAYIERELAKLGLRPAGDEGGFRQQVPLIASTPGPASELRIHALGEACTLVLGGDYLLHNPGSQSWLPRPVPLVFVGYGIVAPEYDYNDYHDLDVRGKVVVFLDGEPASIDDDYFLGAQPSVHAAVDSKRRVALSRGAVGSVLIPSLAADEADGWQALVREYGFEHMVLAYSLPQHLSLVIRPQRARELFEDALYPFELVLEWRREHRMRSFHLRSSLSFTGDARSRSFLAPNLVAILDGEGRRAASTAVVVSAHYDHLGVGPEVNGDGIYNGVVDNALGVAGVLELARLVSVAQERPRRSILFLFTTAEEKGMLGARYFLDHPPLPLPALVADINVDGLAFMDRFREVIGIGAELSDLGRMLQRAAARVGVEAVAPPPEIWSHEGFTRSEQVVFADAGIPSILVNEGFVWEHHDREEAARVALHWMLERYHSPADDLFQPLDFTAAAEHCWVLYELLLEVAEAPLAPEWKAGVSYAYQRALSRAEAQR